MRRFLTGVAALIGVGWYVSRPNPTAQLLDGMRQTWVSTLQTLAEPGTVIAEAGVTVAGFLGELRAAGYDVTYRDLCELAPEIPLAITFVRSEGRDSDYFNRPVVVRGLPKRCNRYGVEGLTDEDITWLERHDEDWDWWLDSP